VHETGLYEAGDNSSRSILRNIEEILQACDRDARIGHTNNLIDHELNHIRSAPLVAPFNCHL